MVFTRSQAKKHQEQQKQPQQPQQRQQIHRKCKKTLHEITTITNTNTNTNTRSPIDFIDASIEWRKNKIKRENCTFEYIFL
jgi:hypothetical protein